MREVSGILVAAHDLKAPLTTIRQLALALDGMDEEGEGIRTEMVNVSERALRQVNDLVKLPQLEEGLFKMEPVAIRAVCDDVLEELVGLFDFDRQNFKVRYQNRSRLVTANKELLSSVIYNFLSNAIHYSSGRKTRTELLVGERAGKIRVEIRDFGPALPIKIWREMKDGFIAEPKSIAMRPGSSGLGLYIASKFAKYMDAKVGAVRHRDGTSFFVELAISKQMSLWGLE
ncbi:MAG: HAMP domain-containing sensor histidine kinase [Candidatus Saccharibacteria bacterium]|nr:HAMP domain-containing sensor histidine kinase [Candidatus Saccharibacteria bacterium]